MSLSWDGDVVKKVKRLIPKDDFGDVFPTECIDFTILLSSSLSLCLWFLVSLLSQVRIFPNCALLQWVMEGFPN